MSTVSRLLELRFVLENTSCIVSLAIVLPFYFVPFGSSVRFFKKIVRGFVYGRFVMQRFGLGTKQSERKRFRRCWRSTTFRIFLPFEEFFSGTDSTFLQSSRHYLAFECDAFRHWFKKSWQANLRKWGWRPALGRNSLFVTRNLTRSNRRVADLCRLRCNK